MATYYNDFNKEKDFMMWESHEIRHKMQQENLCEFEINMRSRKILENWKEKHKFN